MEPDGPPAPAKSPAPAPPGSQQHAFIKKLLAFQRFTARNGVTLDIAGFCKGFGLAPDTPFVLMLEEAFEKLTLDEHVDSSTRRVEAACVCPSPSCGKPYARSKAVACQGCLFVHYCSRECRTADLRAHRDHHCEGSRDLALRQTMAAVLIDVDDWNARRRVDSDKGERVPGHHLTWRAPMPFIINTADFDPEYTQSIMGKRSPAGCLALATYIMYDAITAAKARADKMQLNQLITADRQFVRCNVCLKATGCNADLFLTGQTKYTKTRTTQHPSLNMLVAGFLLGIDAQGACNGWLWTACSPECMSLAQPAITAHILFSIWPSFETGRVNVLTNVQSGLGLFIA